MRGLDVKAFMMSAASLTHSPAHGGMLRLFSAASGEAVAALDASEFDALVVGRGSTVGSLKRHLAARHFERKYTRFQLRILREAEELQDGEVIELPMDLQLIFMNHLQPNQERDERFFKSCDEGRADEVEQGLRKLQNPNVRKRRFPYTPLETAVFKGRCEVFAILLEAGADREWRDLRGRRPLHWTSGAGRLGMVRELLAARAEVEAEDVNGLRPLHLAAGEGHLEVLRLLLTSAALEAQDKEGNRPLHQAVWGGHVDAAQLLLVSKADLEAAEENGLRPLHLAAMMGHLDLLRLLLDAGAQDAEDGADRRPVQLANGRAEVVRLLDARDAKRFRAEKGQCHWVGRSLHLNLESRVKAEAPYLGGLRASSSGQRPVFV